MSRIQQLIDHTDSQLAQEEELLQLLVRLLVLIDEHLLTENIRSLQELKVEVTFIINLIRLSSIVLKVNNIHILFFGAYA